MSADRKHFWHSGSRAVSVCSLDSLSILIEALKVRSGSSADERLDFRDLSVVRSRNGEPGKKFCLNVIKVHFVPPRPRFLFSTFALVGESKRRMRGAKNTCFTFPEFSRTKDEENNLSRLEENEITVFNYLMRSVLFSISGCSNHLEAQSFGSRYHEGPSLTALQGKSRSEIYSQISSEASSSSNFVRALFFISSKENSSDGVFARC